MSQHRCEPPENTPEWTKCVLHNPDTRDYLYPTWINGSWRRVGTAERANAPEKLYREGWRFLDIIRGLPANWAPSSGQV